MKSQRFILIALLIASLANQVTSFEAEEDEYEDDEYEDDDQDEWEPFEDSVDMQMEDYDLVDEEDFEDDDYFEEKYQGSEMADYRTHVSFTHSTVTKCDYSGIQKFQ